MEVAGLKCPQCGALSRLANAGQRLMEMCCENGHIWHRPYPLSSAPLLADPRRTPKL